MLVSHKLAGPFLSSPPPPAPLVARLLSDSALSGSHQMPPSPRRVVKRRPIANSSIVKPCNLLSNEAAYVRVPETIHGTYGRMSVLLFSRGFSPYSRFCDAN